MITRRLLALSSCIVALAAFSVGSLSMGQPAEQEMIEPTTGPTTQPKPLVYIERGTLPIILSAPHGGRMVIPGAERRTGKDFPIKRGVKNNFATGYDGPVDEVTFAVADELERLTGERPYIVVANFARRFVDANRVPEQAYESEAGRIVYEAYHNAIRTARSEIISTHKRGLLLDIHGHGRGGPLIIRGTADWTSVRHVAEEFGKESITGKTGLLAPFANHPTWKMVPTNDKDDELEFAALNGGFITRHYGSYAGGNFDSIQFELGSTIRRRENIPEFAKLLAKGIAQYQDQYILNIPTTQPTQSAQK